MFRLGDDQKLQRHGASGIVQARQVSGEGGEGVLIAQTVVESFAVANTLQTGKSVVQRGHGAHA
jgi:hypothetical protein